MNYQPKGKLADLDIVEKMGFEMLAIKKVFNSRTRRTGMMWTGILFIEAFAY